MDTEILWRVAVVQVVSVVALSLLLGLLLPGSFFDSLGWLSGPLAWLGCAWLTARVVGLPVEPVVIRALLAGVPSLLFLLLDMHWLGVIAAVAIFAVWCSHLPRPLQPTR